MDRRPRSSLVALAAVVSSALGAHPVAAAPKDAAAIRLYRDAIETDYLGMQFGAAEKKLRQAIVLCGANGCTPAVLAQLHRDLGIVLLAANRGADAVRAEFALALAVDSTTTLPKDLATPEAITLFDEAKAATAPSGSPTPGNGTEELTHQSPKEAAANTPLPIYVELAEGFNVAKVQVRYKTSPAGDWKALDLKRLPTGYGVDIPCADIGVAPGELRYFIQAVNSADEPVATHGGRNAPHTVRIVAQLSGPPAHLPGKPPPVSCNGPCTPGAPGCAAVVEPPAAAGAPCSTPEACAAGVCREGVCAEGAPSDSKTCQNDVECGVGQVCGGGVCAPIIKKNWISLSLQQEGLFLPSSAGACSGDATYSCFDGPNLYADRSQLARGSDNVEGGFSLATARVLVGYDRVVHTNVTVGAKVGFAFNNGPTEEGTSAFLPIHAEVRAAYWFGAEPTARIGVRPYALLSGGVAHVDAKRRFTAFDRTEYHLQAWRRTGVGFAALGAGAMYAFMANGGITAEVKVLQMFGTSATGLAGQIGYAHGL